MTGAGQAQSDFIRQITLTTKDIVYDPSTKMLYASVPSSAGSIGNSITQVDPVTGNIGPSVFIGSEPGKLAISDNGQYLYTYLEGAFAIRRFDVANQTSGLQFAVKLGPYDSGSVFDMAVVPGQSQSIAVTGSGAVAIYDNGVRRPNIASSTYANNYLQFSPSADTLYSLGADTSGAPLQKISVTSSGVTASGTTRVNGGGNFRLDNGRIYLGTGQVIDAGTNTLLGTFSDVGANAQVVTDSAVGRVYFLSSSFNGSNSTFIIKAYDINTFVLIGSLSIPNVSGVPTSLVRWGANGLAFRTERYQYDSTGASGNQLFLIQTSLVPSSEPVPSPTPTPSPTPIPSPAPAPALSVRPIALPSNDLIYDSNRQLLYASVPSVAGSNGNSITPVNPATGVIGTSVFIGSEPGKLALTDDGHYLYTILNGAAAVRRFDLTTQTPGLQFQLGGDDSRGPNYARDIVSLPGSPEALAISLPFKGVVIYDNGVPRPTIASSINNFTLVSSATGSTLYGSDYGAIYKFSVNASGVTLASATSVAGGGDIRFDNGLIYISGGRVLDPETGTLKGTFTGLGNYSPVIAPAIDLANERVFFLTAGPTPNSAMVRAYDLKTFVPIGSVVIPNVVGTPASLVRWGENGLAFRTTVQNQTSNSIAANGQIYLIQSALVSPNVPVPTPSPTPTPSPSPLPPALEVNQIQLATNDIVYEPTRKLIYASVPGRTGINGNSITPIDPATLNIGSSVFIGSEPKRLALSDNGQYLYAALDGAAAVRRFDLVTQTPGLQFSLGTEQFNGPLRAFDLAVLPGSPQSVAISKGTSNGFAPTIAVYDNGVQRPNTTTYPNTSSYIKFSTTADTLYGYDQWNSSIDIQKISVTPQGVTMASRTPANGSGDFRIAQGRIYMGSGEAIDTQTGTLVGKFAGMSYNSLVAPDPANGRVYFLANVNIFGSGTATWMLMAFDINTFVPIGSVQIPGVTGTPTSLLRWGANGLAFRTGPSSNGGSTPGDDQVFVIRTSLVPSSEVIPPKFTFSSPTYSVNEYSGNATITVNRSGDTSATPAVDYATSDGTASQRNKYITTTGTLTFAPGETSKTFSIPIIDEAFVEGNQTVNLTLSNPNGAGLGRTAAAVLTIIDNDTVTPTTNPLDDAQYFVRQHYYDFLNRIPDQGGLNYWTNQIFQCGSNQSCALRQRVAVSAAYFTSAEFQDTGFFVYLLYVASYGQRPTYAQFMPDRSRVVGGANLDAGKAQFVAQWVRRADFLQQYPRALAGDQFVDKLIQGVKAANGVDLTSQRSALLGLYDGTDNGRVAVVRAVVDNASVKAAEYNAAFVLMQYFGYLRRDPDADGYQFWLKVMNGLDKSAFEGMTCAFITSAEYQERFSSVVTHSNADCGK